MKILRIRAKNLASLREADVDLAVSPLLGAGLFCVTGPTGAGKTTLLDAMCLALYDRTPRLAGASRIQIGDSDPLGDLDPRSLLRRGAPEAEAVVDFLGRDRARWCASWRLWRARRQPSGRLQPQQMELRDAEGRVVSGHRKTDTLAQIADRVGLTFEEFCRSVLLAQGEFAAFLHAPPNERAGLLERLTGTELYAALSTESHRAAKDAAHRVAVALAKIGSPDLLSPEQRLAHQRTASLLSQEAERIGQSARTMRAGRERADTALELSRRLESARRRLSDAEVAWGAASGLREQVALAGLAEAHRLDVSALDDIHASLSAAERSIREARASEVEAEAHADRLTIRTEAAMAAVHDHEARVAELVPTLARAAALDARIQVGEAGLAERDLRLEGARSERAAALRCAEQAEEELSAHTSAVRAARAAVVAEPALSVLAGDWPAWRARIDAWLQLGAACSELNTRVTALGTSVEGADSEVGQAEVNLRDALTLAQGARATVAAAGGRLESLRHAQPPARAREALRDIEVQLETLSRLRPIISACLTLHGEREQATEAIGSAEGAAERSLHSAEAAATAARASGRVLARVRSDLTHARARHTLGHRRPELLRPHEPCPLCGATDHPDAGVPAPDEAEVQRLQAVHDATERECSEQRLRERAHRNAAETHELRAAEARATLNRLDAELVGQKKRWASLLEAADGDGDAEVAARPTRRDVEEALETIEGLASRLMTRRLALEEQRETERLGSETLEAARREQADRDAAVEGYRLALAGNERTAAGLRQHVEEARRELDARLADHSRLTRALEPVSHWAEALRAEEPAAATALAERVSERVALIEGLARMEGRHQSLELELNRARSALEPLSALCAREEADRRRHADELGALTREHTGLLEGEPLALVREQLERTGSRLREALVAAREEGAVLAQRRASLAESIELNEGAAGTWRAALESRQQRLADAGWGELDALRGALERDVSPEDRERVADLRAALDQARAECAAIRSAISTVHDATAATDAAGGPPEEEQVQRAEAAWQSVLERLGAVRGALRGDVERRSERAGELEALGALEREAETLAELASVIGSASGVRFRAFAQSLTLEVLLRYANDNLQRLRPRYQLARVPDYGLALQVIDHDMGSEPRPVASLSGGEAFLVSLALSLALSSIAAKNVEIQSVFIDEGFGTLDDDSLELALTALDELQAAGRQIGLVTHRSELAERIGVCVSVLPVRPGCSVVTTT